MKTPSFLARKTFGQPNYFLIAMAIAFIVALMPRGARQALESNTNKAEDWLPPNYAESTDLRWFRDYFFGEQFALISWDGCTLGDTEQLYLLGRKLIPNEEALAKADADSETARRASWYKHITTGPDVLEQLTSPPLSLSYGDAVKRLEGALVGPLKYDEQGNSLGNESRTTCLMVFLTEEATKTNLIMREAVEHIVEIAKTECAIPEESIHMGGPPVDNITIDVEGERTLQRLALLSGIVGLGLSYWCFRSFKLTGIVFAVGVLSAGMSLAVVFYFGIAEVRLTSLTSPRLGTVDAILMSMPAVVYVLGLSGSIHIVNYYRDARRDHGVHGAAESAVKHGWGPCTLAAFTTAVGLGSLYTSDILPIKKFGMFTAIAVLGTIGILFTVLPVFLHRFPVSEDVIRRQSGNRGKDHLPGWAKSLFGFIVRRHNLAFVCWLVVMGVFAFGFTKITTSVQLLKLLDEDTDLIHDYAWLEENLGNLVPMEVIVTVPEEHCRTAEEHAEANGKQYRMTMLERLSMVRDISARFADMPEVSRVMSAATYTPENTNSGSAIANRGTDYEKNKQLEGSRDALLETGFLQVERTNNLDEGSPSRELWRLSARVAALAEDEDGNSVDYGTFVNELRNAVDPILMSYQQRDMIVADLHEKGKKLDGSKLCILFREATHDADPEAKSQEARLINLLSKSGRKNQTITKYNLAKIDAHEGDAAYLDGTIETLNDQTALILVSAGSDPTAKLLADGGLHVIDVSQVPEYSRSAALPLEIGEAPRPLRAVYTGMIPLVYKTQRQLLYSLKESIVWATVLISVVMMFVLRSPLAGTISMIPNVFPIVIIFGGLGWLGMKIDIGIMMTASVALGVAVDDTVHFLTWFRRGVSQGLNRVEAVMLSYDRCATAMTQTTLIGGLGLAVFATSTFTPTQQFGYLMISMLGAALVGDLLLLPAILVGPLGRYFGGDASPVEQIEDTEATAIDSEAPHPQEEEIPPLESEVTAAATSPETNLEEAPFQPEKNADSRNDLVDGPHAALHAKLRSLRRADYPHDSISSN